MLNQIILMGRLTKDPELRYTQSRKAVASFTLAVERDFSPSGESKITDFIDCVAWNRTAEAIDEHFIKGQMMAVIGRLQFRDWEDRDGKKHRAAEVLVDGFYFCDSQKKEKLQPINSPEGTDGQLPF